jgi:hypothetical protein
VNKMTTRDSVVDGDQIIWCKMSLWDYRQPHLGQCVSNGPLYMCSVVLLRCDIVLVRRLSEEKDTGGVLFHGMH